MKINKKLYISLGVSALCCGVGLATCFSINNSFKSSIPHESKALDSPIENVLLRFLDYPDLSDWGASSSGWLFMRGEFYDINNVMYEAIRISWTSNSVSDIDFYTDYENNELVSFYSSPYFNIDFINGGGMFIRGTINSAGGPGSRPDTPYSYTETEVINILSRIWEVSFKDETVNNQSFILQYPNNQWPNLDLVDSSQPYNLYGDFTLSNGEIVHILNFQFYYSQGHSWLDSVSFQRSTAVDDYIFLFDSGDYDTDMRQLGQYIVGNNVSLYNYESQGETPISFLSNFWVVLPVSENGESETATFTFNDQINYYAPFGGNISSDYYPYDIGSNTHYLYTLYSGWFESGGQTFNRIQLEYWPADGTSYNSSGDVWQGGGCYYQTMFYQNTETGHWEIVNQRDRNTYISGSAYGYYWVKSSTWTSQQYRTIKLYGDIDEITLTKLDTLNNANAFASSFDSTTDVGLGSAFALIGQAFKAGTPILQIQIMPGITLGLLLFLPLIAGIVVFIIWVVKR